MGLDVYLRRYDNHDDTRRREREYERTWVEAGGHAALTADQRDAVQGRLEAERQRLGLNDWGTDDARVENIELSSARHPEHVFKIGYFRSSYNGGGLNRVVGALCGGRDLYWVFELGDEYDFRPDWAACRHRALGLLEAYDGAIKRDGGRLSVSFEAPNSFVTDNDLRARCSSDEAAMEIFRGVREKHNLGSFSNRDGAYFLDQPLEVLGFVYGYGPLDQRGLYVVARGPAEGDDWYRQALEVVIETCDWVLARPDADQFYLAWSS